MRISRDRSNSVHGPSIMDAICIAADNESEADAMAKGIRFVQ